MREEREGGGEREMADNPCGEVAPCLGRRELEAVKKALSSILQQENPLPPHQQEAREAQLTRSLSSHACPSDPAHALHPQDLSILSRLLHQVHHLMEEDSGGEISMRLGNLEKPSYNVVHVATDKNMVETVVEIASAAAEAAKAAAATSCKNLEVMETLLSNSEKSPRSSLTHLGSHNDDECDAKSLEDYSSRPPIIDKDLVKKLERQNRITHWVLGFMIVATSIWRFKLLSMILGVRKRFSNPFQTIGDILSEGFQGGNKEDQNGVKGLQKAKAVLPSLLGAEEKEIVKKSEKSGHSNTKDFKLGEAFTFSFDNILSVGKSNDGAASGSATEEDSSAKE